MTEKTIPESMESFTKFNGFRPRSISPDMPAYNPDRDIVTLVRLINRVNHRLHVFVPGPWHELANALGVELSQTGEDGKLHPSDRMLAVFDRFIYFLEEAAGKRLVHDDYVSKTDLNDFVDFATVMCNFYDPDKNAATVLMAIVGAHVIDAIFFGARQDVVIGRQGQHTFTEMANLASRMGDSLRSGKLPYQSAVTELKAAIRFAASVGVSPDEIRHLMTIGITDTFKDDA